MSYAALNQALQERDNNEDALRRACKYIVDDQEEQGDLKCPLWPNQSTDKCPCKGTESDYINCYIRYFKEVR